jgi:signal transduction histidine kinase/AmiR/NasT family two-component response regulator
MPTIEVLTERVTPIGPDTTGQEVFARFESDAGLYVLPVVQDGRPVGLVERNAFLIRIAGPEGYARHAFSPVSQFMDCEPAVVDAGVQIDAFCDAILNSCAGDLMRGFIVTRQSVYSGVGTALSLVRAASDMQRNDAETARQTAVDRAESTALALTAAQTKSRFLTTMSQELRTPLNGVLAVAELLRRQPLNADSKAHVQTILDSSETVMRILEDAVDLARAEAGELELTAEPTLLRPLMDDLQTVWTPRAALDGVTLMVGYEGDTELAGQIDGKRLRQVFDNLISNALKFARNGVVEASLKATAGKDGVRLEARIRDNGLGIDASVADRIFAPFTHAGADGAGLGLTICREIIERMGGTIRAENNQGRGATFAFDIVVPQATIEDETESNVSGLPELELQAQPHVLIVDDNATNRVVAQALCEMFGCTCETAEDGQEALEAVQARGYDLILMDIKMPRLDGVAATEAIRALGTEASAIPIIALTANADPDDARRYLAVGMAAVVEKPIKPERLRMAMNAALAAPAVTTVQTAVDMARKSA